MERIKKENQKKKMLKTKKQSGGSSGNNSQKGSKKSGNQPAQSDQPAQSAQPAQQPKSQKFVDVKEGEEDKQIEYYKKQLQLLEKYKEYLSNKNEVGVSFQDSNYHSILKEYYNPNIDSLLKVD